MAEMELLPGNLQFVLNTMALAWTAGLNGSLLQLLRTKKHTKDAKILLFQMARLAPRIKHESQSTVLYRLVYQRQNWEKYI